MTTPARPGLGHSVGRSLVLLLALSGCAPPTQEYSTPGLTTPDPLQGERPHIYWADPTFDWSYSDPKAGTATIGGANLDGTGMSEAAVTGVALDPAEAT